MNNFPCVTDFPDPYDEAPRWAHCSGKVNVMVSGDEWIVDFDNNAEITGPEENLSYWDEQKIINKAISEWEMDNDFSDY